MKFEDKKILITHSEFGYLAVLFSGQIGKRLYLKVNQIMQDINERYSHELTDWIGDFSKLEGIEKPLEELIPNKND